MNIYVASSWRNEFQPYVVWSLQERGYEVYVFKNPGLGDDGFHWSEIDENYKNWEVSQFVEALDHPLIIDEFKKDMTALDNWADVVVLLLPCNRSAHAEAGYHAGRGKPVIVFIPSKLDLVPELMYKMFYRVVDNLIDLHKELNLIKLEME